MEHILEVNKLTKVFKKKGVEFVAVDNISFTLNKGESLGIVGESGSGKSTIIKAAMNLLGMNVGPLRMPLSEIEPEHKARLAAAMKAYGLKLAE